jgi:serine/threonine-protein kinase RsbT
MGLPGAKRLMHEFEIRSAVGVGTTIICRKWLT